MEAVIALFFNLEKLESISCNDANKFITLLEYHFNKKTLPSKYDKYKPVPLHGQCFLLNAYPLFSDKSTDVLFKVQYVKLAGRRDYNLYKQYGYKALQTSFFPDLNWDAIRSNPLLTITPQEITFKYEER